MTDSDLRKVQFVNGHKVNHPHSGINIGFAILSLVFAAFPLLMLFLPTVANDPGANGIDVIKYGIDVLKYLSNGEALPPNSNEIFYTMIYLCHQDFRYPLTYLFVFLTSIILVMSFISLFVLTLSIIHLAKGYLRTPGAIPALVGVQMFLAAVYFGTLIFPYVWVKDGSGGQEVVVWFMIAPIVVALFFLITFGVLKSVGFSNSVLESDIEVVEPEPAPVQPKPVEQPAAPAEPKTEEQLSTIPPDVTSIGGHAYAENQSLTIANIPLQITKLGTGAFANCLNLKVVSLPTSVKEIGRNCFFNCASLERINYAGSKEQWSKIKRGSNWLARAKTTEVVCSDATLVVDPYK